MPGKQKKPDKNTTLRKLYEGYISTTNLPKDIYFYNAQKIMSGVNKGFGKITFAYNSPDLKLYESIGDHVYMFSGAKTFQQTWMMSKELIKDGRLATFDEFKISAGKIFDEFNETYLRTEYSTAIDGGRMAEKWLNFERNKKTLPYLIFKTEGDETVCDECTPFDNICLPVNDPFWNEHYPPLHFNCHCDIQSTDDEGEVSEDNEVDTAIEEAPQDKIFANNVGKTGEVFGKDHPYFQVPKEYRKLAEENFNLPIPEKHGRYSSL